VSTLRLTVAQALVRFLAVQEIERDGDRRRFFAGCLGIFGHGNVAGLGQALQQHADLLPYHPARNEQAMVHVAAGYARQRNRLGAFACTTSIGPGATNLVTGAALATINRLPVLLLPGDTFATRAPHPVLQQLEVVHDATVSVNDTLRPVSRYYERVERPEQLMTAALEAMRVLTDPGETGAVTLALPEDVQTEAFAWPEAFLAPRVWTVFRQPPAPEALERAAALVRAARRPLLVAGGGVVYAEATAALRAFAEATGIPVAETQAGRGALVSEHPLSLGAIGATGTSAANALAAEADLVIGVGTRWSDFTTASKTAFRDPDVRFVNLNVTGFDAAKHSGLPLVADARVALDALRDALAGHRADASWERRAGEAATAWAAEGWGRGSARPGRATAPGRRPRRRSSAPSTTRPARPAWWSAPPARPPATCTSSGAPATPRARAITSSTGTRAWATRSPAAWGSSSRPPSARSTCWSATGPT
jgi:3D-(3,5/4)-trihydroxycyclohexane-1,2-dione acylhydrolase (decyclizing)